MLTFGALEEVWLSLEKGAIVVCPDKMGDAAMTKYLHTSWYDFTGPHNKMMGVVQGEDIWQQIEMYAWLTKGAGFRFVGIPRCIPDRIELVRRLKQIKVWDPNVYHHFLGMQGGAILEYAKAANEGINSGDSSSPVWRGVLHQLSDFNVDYAHEAVKTGVPLPVDRACGTRFQPLILGSIEVPVPPPNAEDPF